MKKISYIYVILGGVFWGTIGVFLKILLDCGFTRMQAGAVRMGVAASVLAVYLAVNDRNAFRIKMRDLPFFIGSGVVSIFMLNLLYFYSIEKTGMSVAAVLLYTSPIFVLLISAPVFKEKLTVRKLLALPLTVAGSVFVAGLVGADISDVSAAGVLAGIGSGIAYALYSVFGRCLLNRHYSSATVSLYTFVFAFLASIPFLFAQGDLQMKLSPMAAVGGLGIGLVSCLLPFLFYTKGLEGVENGKAAILATVEPMTATIIGVAAYNEKMTVCKALGIVFIIASIVILSVKPKSARHKKTDGGE